MTTFLPRESVEFLPIDVTVDGAVITTGVQFSVVATSARPSIWSDPATVNGKIGVLVSGLTPGVYRVWAKVTATPETPVIECGTFTIT